MATCAACLRPVLGRAQFVLAGTEVFHRECARNIEHSVSAKQRLEISRLRHELDITGQEASRLRSEIALADSHAERRLDEQARVFHRTINQFKQERDAARTNARLTQELVDQANELRFTAVADRDNARRERDAALLEVRTAGQPLVVPPSVTPVVDGLDDAEQRFRLLELDPLE